MNITDFDGIQLWVGPGYCGGYEIVEQKLDLHSSHEHGYGLSMMINEYGIFDGDGAPTNIDNSYRKITPDEYSNILNILHGYGDKMLELAKSSGRPLDHEITEGDYLFAEGYFYHVEIIDRSSGNHQVMMVEYNKYFAQICWEDECDTLESMWDEEELDEIKQDMSIISKDVFTIALNLAKSAIIEITNYIERLYKINS